MPLPRKSITNKIRQSELWDFRGWWKNLNCISGVIYRNKYEK